MRRKISERSPRTRRKRKESFALPFRLCSEFVLEGSPDRSQMKVKPKWDVTHDEINSKKETAASGPPSPPAATVISTGAKLGHFGPCTDGAQNVLVLRDTESVLADIDGVA